VIENFIKPTEAEYRELPRGNTYVYDFLDLLWIHGVAYLMLWTVLIG
jgi:hypothetical protein